MIYLLQEQLEKIERLVQLSNEGHGSIANDYHKTLKFLENFTVNGWGLELDEDHFYRALGFNM